MPDGQSIWFSYQIPFLIFLTRASSAGVATVGHAWTNARLLHDQLIYWS